MENNTGEEYELVAPLFRGATKPVMFIGIPINALVLTVLPCLLLMIIAWEKFGLYAIACLTPAIFAIPVMRQMTKQDDQYLTMWLLELKERGSWTSKNLLGDVAVIPPKPLRHRRHIKD